MSGPTQSQTVQVRNRLIDPTKFDYGRYNWLHFAGISGTPGKSWAAAFRGSPLVDIISQSEKALLALRQGRQEEGCEILVHIQQEIEELEQRQENLPLSVPKRWLYGIRAFAFYADGDYERAKAELNLAEAFVKDALHAFSFLIPLARACQDFSVQRARVARSERDWPAMWHHLDRARDMVANLQPLCVLRDGSEIFYETVADFCRGCPLSDEERAALEYYYDSEHRMRLFEADTCRIQIPSGFVVPYC